MTDPTEAMLRRYRQARARRAAWEGHWQECYDYALPQRDGFLRQAAPGAKHADRLFDGTAPDAVDQLAASLLARLTPPWSHWFGFTSGDDATATDRALLAPLLDRAAATVQSHFDRSNFAVEMHQCYLDLVTGGTASLLFEEAPAGEPSAFRFTAVPLTQAVLEEGPAGRLDATFRRFELTVPQLRMRYPGASLPSALLRQSGESPDLRVAVVEAVLPEGSGYSYTAAIDDGAGSGMDGWLLAQGRFASSPFINFRWLKAPGEAYGRSPVMKALPDIKTANKVVELVLKNASIAVTGIWQADDDGVLNPATIRLVPGTIIPKAVGSSGLTPLQAPGRFDVSQLVLEDLRSRIRNALLVDRLGPLDGRQMTATEVLERTSETARILGATYGRLQSELLTPLIARAVAILRRRGEVPDIVLDGRIVDLQYRSPLARIQAQQDVQATLLWINAAAALGPDALSTIDVPAAIRWMARELGVPAELVREPADAASAAPLAAAAVEELRAVAEQVIGPGSGA